MLFCTQIWTFSQGMIPVISAGKYSTELAKMMGMTPDWLTLSGM
jgi:hypothetical protein